MNSSAVMPPVKTRRSRTWAALPRRLPDSIWRNDGDALYVIERHGCDVIVVEGFTPAGDRRALELCLQAKKNELKPATSQRMTTQAPSPARVSAFVR